MAVCFGEGHGVSFGGRILGKISLFHAEYLQLDWLFSVAIVRKCEFWLSNNIYFTHIKNVGHCWIDNSHEPILVKMLENDAKKNEGKSVLQAKNREIS